MSDLSEAPPHSDDGIDTEESRFQPGELILGRFRIARPIGKDGMGEVYEAEDLQLGTIAIKTIRPNVTDPSRAFERFCREVRLSRRFIGPQICRIHELHHIPASGEREGTAILTMEYLDGITLADKIRRDGPFPLKQAIAIALEICEGLRLMHEQHVVHRDLKCENIMLCEQNGVLRVVLIDFGLAREFPHEPHARVKTKVESDLRKTGQSKAVGHKPISSATDIYALGVVLYALTTGLNPNSSSETEGLRMGSSPRQAFPRPTVPRGFDRIVELCLATDSDTSFKSVSEVSAALRLAGPTLGNLRRERSSMVWMMSALLGASVAGGVYFLWLTRLFYRMSQSPESGASYRERVAWGLVALLCVLAVCLLFASRHKAQ